MDDVKALITSEEANEVAYLIQEYLNKGRTGFCETSLLSVFDALQEADCIVITGNIPD